MALIKKLERIVQERHTIHEPTTATYSVFTGPDGSIYLQIDTYGSDHRKFPSKKSQSIQVGPAGIERLDEILRELKGSKLR